MRFGTVTDVTMRQDIGKPGNNCYAFLELYIHKGPEVSPPALPSHFILWLGLGLGLGLGLRLGLGLGLELELELELELGLGLG